MDFAILHENIECDCIDGSRQNCIDYFARRGKEKNIGLKSEDFKINKKVYANQFIGCANSCSERSLSVDLWTDESSANVVARLKISINPEFRRKLVIFKIKQFGGLVRPTPVDDNPHHFDFYLPDGFIPDVCLEYVKSINSNNDAV